ncbi:uncharacterized protein LOC124898787 [Capsicum annuum]|uniref:uncharacterized protein LOC124898787 n=1 Tax=Capsicum annuum TaxID=4072 RepID=UPI001FB19A1F|nr:uncharacterized protein LOC124898787 [Capsicum annuum]
MIAQTTNSVSNNEDQHVTMDIPINKEVAYHFIPTQGSHIDDDDTGFYKDQNCDWWLRATKLKSCNRFEIVKYRNTHSCEAQHIISHHPHASADVTAEYMLPSFLNGKGPSTRDIKIIVQADLGCKISYWKYLKISEIAKAIIRGTPDYGYTILDGYCHMLMSVNERSKTSLKIDDQVRFKYFFVSLGAWIRGFVHMKKVLVVDGTFLSGRYDGVLLVAVAQDTENHIFPVAFCVVDKECDAAYQYFFEKPLEIIPNTSKLCIISDMHPSIGKAILKFYSKAHHGCCTRIINAQVANYLQKIGFDKWSRAYFPENRYNKLSSNIVKSVNAILKEEREFPITALFNDISKRWSELFHERRMKYAKLKIIFVPSTETKIIANKNLVNKLLIHQIDEDTFSVTVDNGIAMVRLRSKTCSCREFDLDKIPCQHAMAALRHKFGDEYGKMIYEYSSPYYKVESYILAYANPIYSVLAEEFWNLPPKVLERVIPPPEKKTKPGRKW